MPPNQLAFVNEKNMETASAARLVVGTFLCHLVSGGDKDVWCRLNESCLLEANFTVGDDVVIHWMKLTSGEIHVHSYFHEKDRLERQDKHFKGRTSLFTDRIGKGNSSLLLKEVLFADEGRYKCYVGTLTDKMTSFLNLFVEVPVTKIHIKQADNKLMCSSSGLYPQPQLTWSTKPPLPQALNNYTNISYDKGTRLYNISSWLQLVGDEASQVDYICDIRNHSSRRLTWRKESNVSVSGEDTAIDCPFLIDESSLVWTFNYTQVIVSGVGVSKNWKEQVKEGSARGRLTLHRLSSDYEGLYTCEVSNATETRVAAFFLRMASGRSRVIDIVIGVVAALAVVGVVAGFYFHKKNKGQGQRNVV